MLKINMFELQELAQSNSLKYEKLIKSLKDSIKAGSSVVFTEKSQIISNNFDKKQLDFITINNIENFQLLIKRSVH